MEAFLLTLAYHLYACFPPQLAGVGLFLLILLAHNTFCEGDFQGHVRYGLTRLIIKSIDDGDAFAVFFHSAVFVLCKEIWYAWGKHWHFFDGPLSSSFLTRKIGFFWLIVIIFWMVFMLRDVIVRPSIIFALVLALKLV